MLKKRGLGLLGLVAGMAVQGVHAQEAVQSIESKYNEPTRGFFIEHASVNPTGKASVELHNGNDLFGSGGSVRLGLTQAEVIINNNVLLPDTNEVLVKWAMDDFALNAKQSEQKVNWSILGGLGHQDIDGDGVDAKQTNLTLGVIASTDIDAVTFSMAPKLVIADGDTTDDTYINIDVGAYIGLVDTKAGLFSVGFESIVTTEDDVDNMFFLGGRWAYNEHLNIDVVPFAFGDTDILGVPGLIRVNAAF